MQAPYIISGSQGSSEAETDLISRYVADGLIGARMALQELKHADLDTDEEKDTVGVPAKRLRVSLRTPCESDG